MRYFILKCSSIKNFKYCSKTQFNEDDLFLLIDQKSSKIHGIFKIQKTLKVKNNYCYTFNQYEKYRRGIALKLLSTFNLNFDNRDIYNIKKELFLKIFKKIQLANFPQLSSDQLFISIKNDLIELLYMQNYPEIKFMIKQLKIKSKDIVLLKKIIKNELNQSMQNINTEKFIQEIIIRINKVFFDKFELIKPLQNRFLNLIIDNKLSKIPFELALNYPDKHIFSSRLLPVNNINYNLKTAPINNIRLIFPTYNKLKINNDYELHILKKELSPHNVQFYHSPLQKTDFIKIIENSSIIYFSGHSVFNKIKKEFALKINDKDSFYLSDFIQCINIPNLIILNSCFDYNFIEFADQSFAQLLEFGCKNIIIPISHILQKQEPIFHHYIKLLLNGYKIAEIHNHIQYNLKETVNLPLFFRLYGNSMEKYF